MMMFWDDGSKITLNKNALIESMQQKLDASQECTIAGMSYRQELEYRIRILKGGAKKIVEFQLYNGEEVWENVSGMTNREIKEYINTPCRIFHVWGI